MVQIRNSRHMDSSEAIQSTLGSQSCDKDLVGDIHCSLGNEQFLSMQNEKEQIQNCNEPLAIEFQNQHELVEGPFPSREDLIGYVKSFAFAQGFVVTIKRSSNRDNSLTLGCDRGGRYRNTHDLKDDERKRHRSSRLINCPFEVRGKKVVDGSWKLILKNVEHNHEASKVPLGQSKLRRFLKEDVSKNKEVTSSNVPPHQTLKKGSPGLHAATRDVYNMKFKIHNDYIADGTSIQALVEELADGSFSYNLNYDSDGHLSHIFFVHPLSVTLTKSYTNAFVMDCMYNANKYRMSLIEIIGVTSFNTSFFSCFAFTRNEEENDYIWVLKMFGNILGDHSKPIVIVTGKELALMKAIQVVFPTSVNIFCTCHINKNVLSHCKKSFEEENEWHTFISDWNALVDSSSEKAYYEAHEMFKEKFKENFLALNYIASTWIPHKEHFVKAWTDKCLHFQNRVISRVEGAHASLKSIFSSTNDLHLVKNEICDAIENQFQEIKAQHSVEKIRIPHICRDISFFEELNGNISHFALNELHKQYLLSKSDSLPCICTKQFTTTMGLPCAHEMVSREKLHLNEIHSQWRIDDRTFNDMQVETNGNADQLDNLFDGIKRNYGKWPLLKQKSAKYQLLKLANDSMPSTS